MKFKILVLLFFLSVINLYAQEENRTPFPKHDCNFKKWKAFVKDTVIVVEPSKRSYALGAMLEDLHHNLNYKYIEKRENELSEKDLEKSLLIVGKAADFKKWNTFNLPVENKKKGFVFNGINFLNKSDALWLNDYNRILITANTPSALEAILDVGQLGMDFFTLQDNQLTYFGNFSDRNYSIAEYSNVQNLKKTNYTQHNGDITNLYVSKKHKEAINTKKINENLKQHAAEYAAFFNIRLPKKKHSTLIHYNQEEMFNMIGFWSMLCGGGSSGMNVREEIHCVGANQKLMNHEISHHIFNSNILVKNQPPLLIEGVVEVFTNYKNPKLYKKRINSVDAHLEKFNFKSLLGNNNTFYNGDSSLHYEISGIWVKYFIDTYGLKTFKTLYRSEDKITFIETLTHTAFADFTQNFKVWLNSQKDKLKITFNRNIATYSIVERLVADYKGKFLYVNGKRKYNYLPMVSKAFNTFKAEDNSKIISSTLEYISVVGNQQDLTFLGLSSHNTFPKKGFLYSLEGCNIDKKKLAALEKYLEALRGFYIEKNLGAFFKETKGFTNGAIKEFKRNTPEDYINKMEHYYGQEFRKFIVNTNPFDAFPLQKGDKDFFHGSGPRIETKYGPIATIMTSSFLPITPKSQANSYGFNHPDYVKMIITHEFGHSFINHLIFDSDLSSINHERVFNKDMLEKMKSFGYGNWKVCLIEHLVRLGEIRIAEQSGENERANSLRKTHINIYGFILLPILERKILEYEQHRDRYPTYKDFLPELLLTLNTITSEDLAKLQN